MRRRVNTAASWKLEAGTHKLEAGYKLESSWIQALVGVGAAESWKAGTRQKLKKLRIDS